MCYLIFFFQAEDGIRDKLVTGVQTCALPISITLPDEVAARVEALAKRHGFPSPTEYLTRLVEEAEIDDVIDNMPGPPGVRSEERRVGKSVNPCGRRILRKIDEQRYKVKPLIG